MDDRLCFSIFVVTNEIERISRSIRKITSRNDAGIRFRSLYNRSLSSPMDKVFPKYTLSNENTCPFLRKVWKMSCTRQNQTAVVIIRPISLKADRRRLSTSTFCLFGFTSAATTTESGYRAAGQARPDLPALGQRLLHSVLCGRTTNGAYIVLLVQAAMTQEVLSRMCNNCSKAEVV